MAFQYSAFLKLMTILQNLSDDGKLYKPSNLRLLFYTSPPAFWTIEWIRTFGFPAWLFPVFGSLFPDNIHALSSKSYWVPSFTSLFSQVAVFWSHGFTIDDLHKYSDHQLVAKILTNFPIVTPKHDFVTTMYTCVGFFRLQITAHEDADIVRRHLLPLLHPGTRHCGCVQCFPAIKKYYDLRRDSSNIFLKGIPSVYLKHHTAHPHFHPFDAFTCAVPGALSRRVVAPPTFRKILSLFYTKCYGALQSLGREVHTSIDALSNPLCDGLEPQRLEDLSDTHEEVFCPAMRYFVVHHLMTTTERQFALNMTWDLFLNFFNIPIASVAVELSVSRWKVFSEKIVRSFWVPEEELYEFIIFANHLCVCPGDFIGEPNFVKFMDAVTRVCIQLSVLINLRIALCSFVHADVLADTAALASRIEDNEWTPNIFFQLFRTKQQPRSLMQLSHMATMGEFISTHSEMSENPDMDVVG
ncbi:hypothetical protein 3 [Hubei myriapoda virus 2]|uniref:hypothetical protein 3 n=1 Tax=Hubei myriapoda virus 2 TaxID=1922931 RepID=UPI00090C6594|nr:hypothetical protein 3 [Hubei myriapoda virus 2]APG78383.1 hypothetical protein 3 [Hubei myriapoda virus 2]